MKHNRPKPLTNDEFVLELRTLMREAQSHRDLAVIAPMVDSIQFTTLPEAAQESFLEQYAKVHLHITGAFA